MVDKAGKPRPEDEDEVIFEDLNGNREAAPDDLEFEDDIVDGDPFPAAIDAGDDDEIRHAADDDDGGAAGGIDRDSIEEGEDAVDEDLRGIRNPKIVDRIMRERRLRQQAEQERDRMRQERDGARTQTGATQKQMASVVKTTLEGKIDATKKALRAAKEEGKTDDEIELQSQLNDLQRHLGEVSNTLADLERGGGAAPAAGPAGEGRTKANTPLAERWKTANAWFDDPKFEPQRMFVIALDKQLAAAGYDPSTPKFFEELSKRTAKAFPEVEVRSADNKRFRVATGERRREVDRNDTVLPSGRSDPPRPTNTGAKVTLTREHLSNMRTFGLDPSNKEHAAAYAAEVRRSAQQQRARR